MRRVLKPDGLLFFTVPHRRVGSSWKKGAVIGGTRGRPTQNIIIASRTIVPLVHIERGMPHYLFTKTLILKEFRMFLVQDIWLDAKREHYCVLVTNRK